MLDTDETVFAYSRISPDGRFLAYTSEPKGNDVSRKVERVVRVIDLVTKEAMFSAPGLDAYWSPSGADLIYVSNADSKNLAIWNLNSNTTTLNVASRALGDYPSWGQIGGRDVIVTIGGNYYFLRDGRAEMPYGEIKPCPGIGAGARPLISKTTGKVTVFLAGGIVVRNLTDCNDILVTNIGGAKADFSYDGRYIAFHTPKASGTGYEIHVVDLITREDIRATDLPGSSLYPSWTRDGRLVFRYENGGDRGFVRIEGFLASRRQPLPMKAASVDGLNWEMVFPRAKRPSSHFALVLVWAMWGSHCAEALVQAQSALEAFRANGVDVTVASAVEPTASVGIAAALMHRLGVTMTLMKLSAETLPLTWAHNQIPAVLLFEDGQLVARRLGALDESALTEFVGGLNH